MNTATITECVLNPGLAVLPRRMDSPEARAMLVAIALQESRFQHRRQVRGPARGFYQFEQGGGVRGVMTHSATRALAHDALEALQYGNPDVSTVYAVIEHNDALATAFARLLLWTLPMPLPARDEPENGWNQYIEAWRPGRPHPSTWDRLWREAWEIVG